MSAICYVRIANSQNKILIDLVKDGLYSSKSDVIQEAVSLWLTERGYLHQKVEKQKAET